MKRLIDGLRSIFRRRGVLFAAGYLGIVLFTVLAILTAGRRYTVYLNNPYGSDRITVEYSVEGILTNTGITNEGEYTRFTFKGIKEGKTRVTATIYSRENGNSKSIVNFNASVLPTGVVYLTGYDYGGWQFTLLGMALLTLYSFGLCFAWFRRRKKTQSATTLQNMKFSKKIADEQKENANILFSTTNYHIFRSGMFAAKAGMKADGIGAKTKWYFWPNAQMREFIGLLASEWKINAAVTALTVFGSILFAIIPTIIHWIVK